MAERLAFTTAVKNRNIIEFELDGKTFHFTPGKRAGMTLAVWDGGTDDEVGAKMTKALVDWLSEGLPKDEAIFLRERMESKDDDFDVTDIIIIAKGLLGAASGRPFGSSSDSSSSPETTGKPSTPPPSNEDSTPPESPSTDSSDG